MSDIMKIVANIFDSYLSKLSRIDVFLIIIVIVGLVFSVWSLFRGILVGSQVQIEYLSTESSGPKNGEDLKIVVDVAGAVMKPGVYELVSSSRLKDALVAAGGYSEQADRTYCEKTFNLAQILKDGQKIYVPFLTDTPPLGGYSEANIDDKLININTATISELDTLWGVGPARSEAIVKNRPYQTVDDLVNKGVVSKQVLDRNRGVLSVY